MMRQLPAVPAHGRAYAGLRATPPQPVGLLEGQASGFFPPLPPLVSALAEGWRALDDAFGLAGGLAWALLVGWPVFWLIAKMRLALFAVALGVSAAPSPFPAPWQAIGWLVRTAGLG